MWVGYLPRNVVTIPAHCALVPPCSSAVKEAAVLPEHPRKVSAVTASVTLDGGGATAVSVVLTEDREAAVVVTAGELHFAHPKAVVDMCLEACLEACPLRIILDCLRLLLELAQGRHQPNWISQIPTRPEVGVL